eukprot:9560346-Ditylum_brightwellii.AAC.1
MTAAPETTPESFEDTSSAYRDLISKLRTVTQLQRASAVLSYDQHVFMGNSERTVASRGAQMSALA